MEDEKKNVLEEGDYTLSGPENGDIRIDTLQLNSLSGARRIWKVKSITEKEIIFEIVKFA